MFSPLAPILPADTRQDADAGALLARFDAVQTVLAATALLAGHAPGPASYQDLALRADLSGVIGLVPTSRLRALNRELNSLGLALHAGLVALETARASGRRNRAAAVLLHGECARAFGRVIEQLDVPHSR